LLHAVNTTYNMHVCEQLHLFFNLWSAKVLVSQKVKSLGRSK